MNKKIIGIIVLIIIVWKCYFQNKYNLSIPEKDIGIISFLDIDEDGENLLYTAGEKSYLDKNGEKIPIKYRVISKIKMKDKEYYVAENNKKIGLIDKQLKEIINFDYELLEKINDNFVRGEIDKSFYLIDVVSKKVLGPYKELFRVSNGQIIATVKGEKTFYLDEKGEKIQELEDKNVLFFRGKIAVIEKDGKYGLYNVESKKYVKEENDEIYFSGDNLLVKREGKYFFNDKELPIKKFYPTMNDVVVYDFRDGFGLFDLKDGNVSITPYDEVAPNYDEYVIVGKNGKYGIIDKHTQHKPDYQFDYINKLGKNSYIAGTDKIGLFALVVDNKKVTEEKYEDIIAISENYYIGIEKDSYTLLDKKGGEIVTCKKDELLYYNDKVFIVKDRAEQRFYLLRRDI